jgi:hypothetical protein
MSGVGLAFESITVSVGSKTGSEETAGAGSEPVISDDGLELESPAADFVGLEAKASVGLGELEPSVFALPNASLGAGLDAKPPSVIVGSAAVAGVGSTESDVGAADGASEEESIGTIEGALDGIAGEALSKPTLALVDEGADESTLAGEAVSAAVVAAAAVSVRLLASMPFDAGFDAVNGPVTISVVVVVSVIVVASAVVVVTSTEVVCITVTYCI